MANELEKAITIKAAIDKIDAGDFLLPSIQRRFVWNTEQIELLFDSYFPNLVSTIPIAASSSPKPCGSPIFISLSVNFVSFSVSSL